MHLDLAGAREHLFGGPVAVCLSEEVALRPGDEVVEGSPPRLDFVVALLFGVVGPGSRGVIELLRARAMDLVANETGRLIDEMNALAETILKLGLVSFGDGDTVGDDDHHGAAA